MIEADGLVFRYGGSEPLLTDVGLRIESGLTLLVGPNGCGKSTLMRVLAGIERPQAGSVQIDGHDLWKEEKKARAALAYLPERPEVTPYASVLEILRLVAGLRGAHRDAPTRIMEQIGLSGLEHRTLTRLSQGQRRRVLLGATMIGNVDHLLLDEPLEALDLETKTLFLDWLNSRLAAGATAVVISHTLEPFLPAATGLATVKEGSWSFWPTEDLDSPFEMAKRLATGFTSLS